MVENPGAPKHFGAQDDLLDLLQLQPGVTQAAPRSNASNPSKPVAPSGASGSTSAVPGKPADSTAQRSERQTAPNEGERSDVCFWERNQAVWCQVIYFQNPTPFEKDLYYSN